MGGNKATTYFSVRWEGEVHPSPITTLKVQQLNMMMPSSKGCDGNSELTFQLTPACTSQLQAHSHEVTSGTSLQLHCFQFPPKPSSA